MTREYSTSVHMNRPNGRPRWLVWLLAMMGALAPLGAQPPALPQPVGYVNDFANVIPDEVERRLLNHFADLFAVEFREDA